MPDQKEKNVFVRVKDAVGNEFLCPLAALKKTEDATDEELDNCVDDATVGRYAGDIDVKKKGE